MASAVISQGSLRAIWQAKEGEAPQNPVVQCVQIKGMGTAGQERYRVVFSDVQNFIQALIATQSAHLVTDGILKKGAIVRLTNYNPQLVKGKKIIIVLDLEVLSQYGEPDKIGEPAALDKTEGGEESKPQPAAIASNAFYGEKPLVQAMVAPKALPSRSNAVSNTSSSHGNISPIEALNPYGGKWTIKARCTQKATIKEWNKPSGQGKLFSANFLDESGEIRATAFNDQVDAFYDVIQEGSVYFISSPCKVQLAKKQFSNLANDYELVFENGTMIEKAEHAEDVPQIHFNFTTIGDLQAVEQDSTIDTIGVLKDIGEVSQITSKTTKKPYDKRELTLVDDSLHSVRLTIWGSTATDFNAQEGQVIAFKNVKVSDFGGRSLSLLSSGSMQITPDIDQAHKLAGWYAAQGSGMTNFQTHQNAANTGGRTQVDKTIADIKNENLGTNEKPDYFNLKATVLFIKNDSFCYPACRTEITERDGRPCNKKVIDTDPGVWSCEACSKTWDAPQYRYVMLLNVQDHTGQLWLSCFDETGVMIMGMTANELMTIKESEDGNTGGLKVASAFMAATCQTFLFRCRASTDNFQDQPRIRYQISSATPLNYTTECHKLMESIKQYQISEDSLFVSQH